MTRAWAIWWVFWSNSQTPLHPLHPSPTLLNERGTPNSPRATPSHKLPPSIPGGDSREHPNHQDLRGAGQRRRASRGGGECNFPGGKICQSHRSNKLPQNTKDRTKTKRENKTTSISCKKNESRFYLFCSKFINVYKEKPGALE